MPDEIKTFQLVLIHTIITNVSTKSNSLFQSKMAGPSSDCEISLSIKNLKINRLSIVSEYNYILKMRRRRKNYKLEKLNGFVTVKIPKVSIDLTFTNESSGPEKERYLVRLITTMFGKNSIYNNYWKNQNNLEESRRLTLQAVLS